MPATISNNNTQLGDRRGASLRPLAPLANADSLPDVIYGHIASFAWGKNSRGFPLVCKAWRDGLRRYLCHVCARVQSPCVSKCLCGLVRERQSDRERRADAMYGVFGEDDSDDSYLLMISRKSQKVSAHNAARRERQKRAFAWDGII